MNLKLNDMMIIVYFILLSLVLKTFLFVPLLLTILVIIFGEKLEIGVKNLIYIILATLPFGPFTVYLLFYLPFMIFGVVFTKQSFLKSFVFGFTITHIVRLIVYYSHSSFLNIPLTEMLFFAVYGLFFAIAYYVFYKKYGVNKLKSVFIMKSSDFHILLVTLFFVFFVTFVMYNDVSLHTSNATEIYIKQSYVIDMIKNFGLFGQYYPGTGLGEQFFLTDSHTHFTKDILVLSTLYLKKWFSPLLIYNAYQIFIVWMVVIGSAVLFEEIFIREEKDKTKYMIYLIILGSLAIGLSFQFIRILESFKSYSAHPINLLLFALIFSKSKKPAEWFIMGYLMVLTFLVHAIQAIGVFFYAVAMLIVLYYNDFSSIKSGINYLWKNRLKVIIVGIIFIGVLFAYISVGAMYDDYIREHRRGLFAYENFFKNIKDYTNSYLFRDGVSPFSFSYGELNRLDHKESGFFLTFFGILSMTFLALNYKSKRLKKARLWFWAFVVGFILYGAVTHIFNMGTLEPGLRIIHPYTVVLLSLSVTAMFSSFAKKELKILSMILFFIFLMHGFKYARINLDNIHNEYLISGGTLNAESEFVKNLPNDGRFITYGLFANAVDAGLSYTTGHYFTRYQYNFWNEKGNVYEKIHTTESFGNFPELNSFSGLELRNLFDQVGYKYMFVNVGHPAGNIVVEKMYPNYTEPIYQNNALVMLMVPNISYAEKITLLKDVDEEIYKTENGSWYYSVSRLKRFPFDYNEALKYAVEGHPKKPIPLTYNRINPQVLVINGDFEDGEWVVFKEEYFPRWSAYMNDKKMPIYATNHNMILVKSDEGNQIILRYDILPTEKLYGTISLITIVLCALSFVYFIKIN